MMSSLTNRTIATDLLALTKPGITAMCLLMCLAGLLMAPVLPTAAVGMWTLIGTALVVGSANALNMYLERDSDGHMSRTHDRPLPSGRLNPTIALALGLAMAVLAVFMLTLVVNPLTAAVAAAGHLSYVWIYTPLKKKTSWAMYVGTFPGAIPPVIGWAAATHAIGDVSVILFLIMVFWQLPHFLAIAQFRRDEYTNAGIRVLPAVHGTRVTKIHAIVASTALVPISCLLTLIGACGVLYLICAVGAGLYMWWTTWWDFSGPDDARWARRVFIASLFYLPILVSGLILDRFLS